MNLSLSRCVQHMWQMVTGLNMPKQLNNNMLASQERYYICSAHHTHTQFKVCAWGGARERDKSFCLSLSISESLPPSPVFLISVCMEQQVDMFSFFSVFHITQSWTTIWTPIPVLWRVDIAVVDVGFASVNVISTMKVQVNEKASRDVGMFPDIKHLTVAQWSGIFLNTAWIDIFGNKMACWI